MLTSADLQACRDAVSQVSACLDRLEADLLASRVDDLPAASAELGECLQHTRVLFERHFPEGTLPPADLVVSVTATHERLGLLQQTLLQQRAAVQRGLGALFPEEQANAYARLGQGGGGPARKSGAGYLKA